MPRRARCSARATRMSTRTYIQIVAVPSLQGALALGPSCLRIGDGLEQPGRGEGGTIAAAAALTNAVCDALAPFGVEPDRLPVTAESIWRALVDARAKG